MEQRWDIRYASEEVKQSGLVGRLRFTYTLLHCTTLHYTAQYGRASERASLCDLGFKHH